MKKWNVNIKQTPDGENSYFNLPDEVIKLLRLHEGDLVDFRVRSDGAFIIVKAKKHRHLWKSVNY